MIKVEEAHYYNPLIVEEDVLAKQPLHLS